MNRFLAICIVAVIAISGVVWSMTVTAQQKGASTLLAFPSDYRTWTHTHTNIIDDAKDPFYGYHNVYVNPVGAKAAMDKGAYPDGTKLVVAFYAVQKNGTLITQGNHLSTALMVKNKAQFASTGGWGYALFGPDNVAKPIDQAKDCYGCHEPKKATDYVFSSFVK